MHLRASLVLCAAAVLVAAVPKGYAAPAGGLPFFEGTVINPRPSTNNPNPPGIKLQQRSGTLQSCVDGSIHNLAYEVRILG